MKLHILIPLIGAAFLMVCVGVLIFVGQQKPTGEPAEEFAPATETSPTTTESTQGTAVFTEEERVPSVPANAEATAPVCDQGSADRLADPEEMQGGDITSFTKESVVHAIIRRNSLFRTAPASCLRTYFATGFSHDGGDWSELADMSDEKLVALARFMAAMSDTSDAAAFRARMISSEAVWQFDGTEMRIDLVDDNSTTTQQGARFYNGVWY